MKNEFNIPRLRLRILFEWLYFSCLVISIYSCEGKAPRGDCAEPELKQCYVTKLVVIEKGNELEFYSHYLSISNYEERCFNDYDFVSIAYAYIKKATDNVPIGSVIFCSECKADPLNENSVNWGLLRESALLRLGFDRNVSKGEAPNMSNITFWENGKPRKVSIPSHISSNHQ